jgi:hypothetical protein
LPFLHIGLSIYHAKVYVGNKKRERERERRRGRQVKRGFTKEQRGQTKKRKGEWETKQSDMHCKIGYTREFFF